MFQPACTALSNDPGKKVPRPQILPVVGAKAPVKQIAIDDTTFRQRPRPKDVVLHSTLECDDLAKRPWLSAICEVGFVPFTFRVGAGRYRR